MYINFQLYLYKVEYTSGLVDYARYIALQYLMIHQNEHSLLAVTDNKHIKCDNNPRFELKFRSQTTATVGQPWLVKTGHLFNKCIHFIGHGQLVPFMINGYGSPLQLRRALQVTQQVFP